MYNRYIPQPDGTYRRSAVPDRTPPPPPRQAAPSAPPQREQAPPQEHPQQPEQPSRPTDQRPRHCRPPQRRCPRNAPPPPKQESGRDSRQDRDDRSGSIAGFLKNLLPRDFDTGDLLIVILLLLMSADCSEDQNTALLTLVLYLFL